MIFVCVVPNHSVDRFLDLVASGEASIDRVITVGDMIHDGIDHAPDVRPRYRRELLKRAWAIEEGKT